MTDLEEIPEMPHPMPRLPEVDVPIPSRQHLVSVSGEQARYCRPRRYRITHGIIHMTAGGTLESSEGWANRAGLPPEHRVSWHLGVERFGTMRRFCAYSLVAYHAGRSEWEGAASIGGSLNDVTVGIELANRNDGREPVGMEQYLSTVWAAAVLSERFSFPGSHWLGHWEVSPGRKTDPHVNVFNMQSFRADVVEELARRARARGA